MTTLAHGPERPFAHAGEAVHEVVHEAVIALEDLFRPPLLPSRALGFDSRASAWFFRVTWTLALVFAVAWTWDIWHPHDRPAGGVDRPARVPVTAATSAVVGVVLPGDRPAAAYLTDAVVTRLAELRGASGKLRVVMHAPGDPVAPSDPAVTTADGLPSSPIERLAVRVGNALRPVADLSVLTLTPLSQRRNGRIGLYYVGMWPTEKGKGAASTNAGRGNYAPPRGLIQVTRETQDTPLSEHLRLRDYVTHDQVDVWPKYVVVDPRIVDKDELVLAELERRGISARGLHILSGFRTPQYNAGGGDPRGRAGLSRHMYGDANDLWIDNTGSGQMDDLNHDGRRDIRDAQVICDAVDKVEQDHPDLVGGCGIYPGNGAHGPFTHIDARGYRARWTGSGDGG